MSTEYIHVTEFLQTILCFSILVLIGQRFIMTWKGQDQKYLQHRLQEIEQQILWEKKHQRQQGNQERSSPQNQPQPQMSHPQQQTQPQYPQEPTLKTSLNDYQNDQTARKISDISQPQQRVQYKRKSLTDLAKQHPEQRSKQIQVKDVSDASSSRKPSLDSRQGQDRDRGITNELDRSQIAQQKIRYPSVSVPAQNLDINQQYRNQVQRGMKLQIFMLIDTVFNEHLSVLMCMLVLGILTESTFITSMISLFGYVITHLLLRLKQSMDKADNQPQMASKFSAFFPLLPKLWIFVLFINYWGVVEYSVS